MFGSRHSCLDTRAPFSVLLCERAVASSLVRALLCPRVFCVVARSSCFYRLRAFMLCLLLCGTQLVFFIGACFHVVMSCVKTRLMSILISDLFCWPCACVFFCVSTWLFS